LTAQTLITAAPSSLATYRLRRHHPLARMRFVDKAARPGAKYEVIAVNSVGFESKEALAGADNKKGRPEGRPSYWPKPATA
jgi:hypothetical protein